MGTSRIIAVDHVELDAPPGLDGPIRWFYGDLCGLEEVTCVGRSDVHLCFRSAKIELRFRITTEPSTDPVSCRVAILVPDLHEAMNKLVERRMAFDQISGILFTDRRLEVLDPSGHRVVLKQMPPLCGF